MSLTLRTCLMVTRAISAAAVILALLVAPAAHAQPPEGRGQGSDSGALPSIADKVDGLEKLDGFFPLYWDAEMGQLWMEVPSADSEAIYVSSLSAGIGSNDIGLDRGQLGRTHAVRFDRVGRKLLMAQPNLTYRAISDNPNERRAVKEAFAQSILWGFTVAAEIDGRMLVDMTSFLMRDAHGVSARLRPAQYRLDASRSAMFMERTKAFPKNTEMDVTLTFTVAANLPNNTRPGGFGGNQSGPGGGFGRGSLGAVTPDTSAVTVRQHHSFIELPDPDAAGGFEPRAYDPRSGFGSMSYQDYAVPLGTSLTRRSVRRHRLNKADPSAAVSDPIEPIIYYLDRGTPEPIASALMDGAGWWNQAFEAAGYRNAFQVKMMPEGADNLDVRYNVIQWVHRSTRGWSYGSSITDPRTGEILKGHVTLGSLRVRQDYMIAEGLLAPYANGTETPPELAAWALARLRQLSAHEVGHTIGLGHNYYASSEGRISVMDYPHPLIDVDDEGNFDFSEVYDDKIGEWDKVTINYGYRDFPPGADESEELRAILDEAWERDIIYMTNQDMSAQPRVHQWANGNDPVAELDRMMRVRRAALDRFDERVIKLGQPLAELEEVLVPLYLHHRYQVQATASAIGGSNYHYALRGDGHGAPAPPVTAAEQEGALDSLLATLQPSELALPRSVLALIAPRPTGYPRHRELFPRYTGLTFDSITPAVVAAQHVASQIFNPARAARLVQQHSLDESLPGLDHVLDKTLTTVFAFPTADGYEAEVARAVQRTFVEQLMTLTANASMPQVRAIATSRLAVMAEHLSGRGDMLHTEMTGGNDSGQEVTAPSLADAHLALLASDIGRFLHRPAAAYSAPRAPQPPPGAPIGQAAPQWIDPTMASGDSLPPTGSLLNRLLQEDPICLWEEQ